MQDIKCPKMENKVTTVIISLAEILLEQLTKKTPKLLKSGRQCNVFMKLPKQ